MKQIKDEGAVTSRRTDIPACFRSQLAIEMRLRDIPETHQPDSPML